MSQIKRYFQAQQLKRHCREWKEAGRALEEARGMVQSCLDEALQAAENNMATKDIDAERAHRIRAQAFREALALLGAIELRYHPKGAPVPKGWERTGALVDSHHGEYADILARAKARPSSNRLVKLVKRFFRNKRIS